MIETSQLFLNRQTDVDDLMLNTVGVILGLLLYKLLNRKNKYFIRKFRVD
ncbi:MAG: VanZ family protein [Lachnospiraceae bacterium]|nr:VanZ family protein [Lachnospiraceae bacterium]